MKFVPQSDVIEAEQWFPFSREDISTLVVGGQEYGCLKGLVEVNRDGTVHLVEQRLIRPGDYLVKSRFGEYIMAKEAFESYYAPHFEEPHFIFVDVPPLLHLLAASLPFVN